ncbi:hypothetical protein ACFQVC_00945 [Streptomyces monticola]|uniref:PE-PGRS family protein n=1 Tax=Streptomyces monticola TaxID=2666263 RepID=A0ABW2JB74_9ACTN
MIGPPADGPRAEQHHDGRPAGPLLGERAGPYRRRSGQVAAVLLYGNGGHSVIWPDRAEHHNKPWIGSAYTAFEVLLGRYVTDFELALPAAGDDQSFAARVRLEWEVEDPYAVVTKSVRDIRLLLEGELLDALRPISRRFRPTDAQRVDESVQDERRAGRLDLGRDLGLRTTIRVFIDLSEEVGSEVGAFKSIGKEAAKKKQELHKQHEIEAEEQRLFEARARDIEQVLRGGREAEIVYLMSRNPEKEWDILEAVRREKREEKADFIALFNRLIDSGMLERHDVGEQTYEVLQYLRDSTNKVLPDNARRPLTAPEGRRPRRQIEERGREPEPDVPPWETDEDAVGSWGEDESWDPDEESKPKVHEPTRVDPGSERAHARTKSRNAKPSSAFDDWGDE